MKDNLIAGLKNVTEALEMLSEDHTEMVKRFNENMKSVIRLNARIKELEVELHKKELELQDVEKDRENAERKYFVINRFYGKTCEELGEFKQKASKLNAEKRKFMDMLYKYNAIAYKAVKSEYDKWLKERKKGDQS